MKRCAPLASFSMIVAVSAAACGGATFTYHANVVSCADQKPIPGAKLSGPWGTAATDSNGVYNDTFVGVRSDKAVTVEKAGYSKKDAVIKPDAPISVCLDRDKH